MESTTRNISHAVDSSTPLDVIYRRSTSLSIPDDCEGELQTNLVAQNKSICRDISDDRVNSAQTGGSCTQEKKASCNTIHSEFLGFGATPPRVNTKTKQSLQPSLFREGSQASLILLKDAERLVQNVLQDFTIKISQETVSRAIQQNSVLQSKKKYSSLLEKPWRITSHALHENVEVHGSDLCTRSSAEMIRRSLSSDSITLPSSVDELVHAKKALEQANERILSLQKDLEMLRDINESIDNPKNYDEDSLSSTNIYDEGEIVALSSTESVFSATNYDGIRPPLDFVRAPSPEHRLRKKITGSDNFVSRLEYRALQIRNEQLLQKISLLENELSPDAIDGLNDDVTGSSLPEVSFHESEKEALSGILSKLTHIDKNQQVKYMETKITALIKQLQQSESKCQFLADNEIVAKATIENLSTQLLECEQKAKEFNERLITQTENRLKESNQDLMRMEQELNTAKEDFSLMKSARLAAESKCLQLEQMHSKVVSSLQSQLNHSEIKSQRLQGEVNNLMATAVEMMQVKSECELLQNKLRQSENRAVLQQSNDDLIRQVAVKDAQDRADVHIAQLEVALAAANAKNEIATQRLTNLELAQAKEQEILSEELRESEITIACLMEEIASLKLLSTDIVTLEKQLDEKQADYELLELKIEEATTALTRSEAEVEDLRNELGMLTSLPEILQKMEKELKIAQSKLAESGESSFGITDIAAERDQNTCIADYVQLLEVREAYHMAEEEVTELKSQLDLLKPLAFDLENAEHELRETCAKLDKAELEVEILTNQLDMVQTSLTLRNQELQQCHSEIIALHDQLKSRLPDQLESGIEYRSGLTLSGDIGELKVKGLALVQDFLIETEKQVIADKPIADLEFASLVAKQHNTMDADETKSGKLTIEFASLIADRDSWRNNLATLTTKIFELEKEIKQKDVKIQDLMLRQNNENSFDCLREERDRTLERCTSLSLQLTESQFKIDLLTEQLRSIQKTEMVFQQQQTTATRPGVLFQSLISSSIDRINSRLDDSLPGLKRGK